MGNDLREIERYLKGLFNGPDVTKLRPSGVWPKLEEEFGEIAHQEREALLEKVGIYLTIDRLFVLLQEAIKEADIFIGNAETLQEDALWSYLSSHGLCPMDEEDKVKLILMVGLVRDTKGNLVIPREVYASR